MENKFNNFDKKAWNWLGENELAYTVWQNKYRFNDETFDQWLDRLGNNIEGVRELIENKCFIYGGRILANLNTGTSQGISNCTTLGYVPDNLEGIMDVAKNLALSYKKEAGVGICLSQIRPKGSKIGQKGVSDGIIGFMKIFNEVTANISRGNQRRGAMLVGLHCDHPDVEDFIRIKKDNKGAEGMITSANISVLITDEFMRHYEKGESYRKDFVVESTGEVIEHIVDTVKIMNMIVDHPKRAFEPGILFVDRYREGHLFGQVEEAKKMFNNACSEFIGVEGTVCLLGSMKLDEYVLEELGTTTFDFEKFGKDVKLAIRALDKAHDYGFGRNGIEVQNDRARDYRGLGLGITALADMFMKMGITYGSKESVDISKKIAEFMREKSIEASQELAIELGQPKGIVEYEKELDEKDVPHIKGLRNNSLLSIAPAGSLSLLFNSSSGIEPVFRKSYFRKTESLHNDTQFYEVFHKPIQNIIDRFGYTPDYCVDTTQIKAEDKVDVICAWQKYVDLSISNTTNFHKDATVEEIKNLYIHGWKNGSKGLTVYVDGSIEGVLSDNGANKEVEIPKELKRGYIEPKSDNLIGKRVEVPNGCGVYTLHMYKNPETGKIFDCFINSKSQGCSSNVQSIAVLLSLLLRAGVSLDRIESALNGAGACPSFMVGKAQGRCSSGRSCGTAIVKALKDYESNTATVKIAQEKVMPNEGMGKCPECGELGMKNESGCNVCTSCGYSKCS